MLVICVLLYVEVVILSLDSICIAKEEDSVLSDVSVVSSYLVIDSDSISFTGSASLRLVSALCRYLVLSGVSCERILLGADLLPVRTM